MCILGNTNKRKDRKYKGQISMNNFHMKRKHTGCWTVAYMCFKIKICCIYIQVTAVCSKYAKKNLQHICEKLTHVWNIHLCDYETAACATKKQNNGTCEYNIKWPHERNQLIFEYAAYLQLHNWTFFLVFILYVSV